VKDVAAIVLVVMWLPENATPTPAMRLTSMWTEIVFIANLMNKEAYFWGAGPPCHIYHTDTVT